VDFGKNKNLGETRIFHFESLQKPSQTCQNPSTIETKSKKQKNNNKIQA